MPWGLSWWIPLPQHDLLDSGYTMLSAVIGVGSRRLGVLVVGTALAFSAVIRRPWGWNRADEKFSSGFLEQKTKHVICRRYIYCLWYALHFLKTDRECFVWFSREFDAPLAKGISLACGLSPLFYLIFSFSYRWIIVVLETLTDAAMFHLFSVWIRFGAYFNQMTNFHMSW